MCLNGYFCLLFVDNSQKFLYEADLFGHVCWRCLMRKCDMRTTKQVKFSVCPHRCVRWVCYFQFDMFRTRLTCDCIVPCCTHNNDSVRVVRMCATHTGVLRAKRSGVSRARSIHCLHSAAVYRLHVCMSYVYWVCIVFACSRDDVSETVARWWECCRFRSHNLGWSHGFGWFFF